MGKFVYLTYEYKIIHKASYSEHAFIEELNHLGALGWHIYNVPVHTVLSDMQVQTIYLLELVKPEED